jgi:type I site-specific restriction endonuclease
MPLLFIRRLGKEAWVKRNMKRGKTIVFCMQQHHASFIIFCRYKSNLMFQNSIDT